MRGCSTRPGPTTRTTRRRSSSRASVLESGEVPAVRGLAQRGRVARPGAAPFSPYSGTQYMSAQADGLAYKRFARPRPDQPHGAQVRVQVLRRRRGANWDIVIVEARDVTVDPDGDTSTTVLADTDGAGTADVSLSREPDDELPKSLAERRHSPTAVRAAGDRTAQQPAPPGRGTRHRRLRSRTSTDWDVDLAAAPAGRSRSGSA